MPVPFPKMSPIIHLPYPNYSPDSNTPPPSAHLQIHVHLPNPPNLPSENVCSLLPMSKMFANHACLPNNPLFPNHSTFCIYIASSATHPSTKQYLNQNSRYGLGV